MRLLRALPAAVPFAVALAVAGPALAPGQAALAPGQAATGPGPAATGPGPAATGPADLLATQRLTWSECYPGRGAPQLECTRVRVPLDWSRPNGSTIAVAVSRVKATDPARRRGVLFTNPGGPGAPGLTLSLYLARTEPEVAAVYDVIGLDPRGVGASSPRLECAPPSVLVRLYNLDGRNVSAANQQRFRELNERFAHICAAAALTRYVTTDQAARDLDLIRAVLGEQRISYVGYSAGTWLGARYAALFPQRIDRFLFDGIVNVTAPGYAGARRQPRGFQNSFENHLLPWIADHDDVFGLGATADQVGRRYEARRAALQRQPLRLADGRRLTAAAYDSGIVGGLYWTGWYERLATALSIVERYPTATTAERKVVTEVFGSSTSQGADAFWAITCQDDPAPSYRQILADTARFRPKYPLTGANWNVFPCSFWPGHPKGSPARDRPLPRLLLLNNDADPATPLVNAEAVRAANPNVRLVTVRDQPDHTIYGRGDACVEAVADAWLLTGTLPARDVTCPGLPLPQPGQDEARGDARSGAVGRPLPAGVWARRSGGDTHAWPRTGGGPR